MPQKFAKSFTPRFVVKYGKKAKKHALYRTFEFASKRAATESIKVPAYIIYKRRVVAVVQMGGMGL